MMEAEVCFICFGSWQGFRVLIEFSVVIGLSICSSNN